MTHTILGLRNDPWESCASRDFQSLPLFCLLLSRVMALLLGVMHHWLRFRQLEIFTVPGQLPCKSGGTSAWTLCRISSCWLIVQNYPSTRWKTKQIQHSPRL